MLINLRMASTADTAAPLELLSHDIDIEPGIATLGILARI